MDQDVWVSPDWRGEVGVEVDAEGVVMTLLNVLVFGAKVLCRHHRLRTKAHQNLSGTSGLYNLS